MSELVPFTYGDRPVRTVLVDGEPWFVAADVCAVLGLTNITEALRGLDQDEFRTTEVVDSAGRNQQGYIVNEPGLYSLILRSRKPEAKPFKRWIVHEVVPSIRRTGSYGQPAFPDITTPSGVLAMAERFTTTARQLVAAETRAAELAPKAEAFDSYLTAAGGQLIREVTKEFRQVWPGLRVHELFNFLVAERLIFRKSGAVCGQAGYDAHSQYVPVHFLVIPQDVQHARNARKCVHTTVHVTPRGIELIRKRMQEKFNPAA